MSGRSIGALLLLVLCTLVFAVTSYGMVVTPLWTQLFGTVLSVDELVAMGTPPEEPITVEGIWGGTPTITIAEPTPGTTGGEVLLAQVLGSTDEAVLMRGLQGFPKLGVVENETFRDILVSDHVALDGGAPNGGSRLVIDTSADLVLAHGVGATTTTLDRLPPWLAEALPRVAEALAAQGTDLQYHVSIEAIYSGTPGFATGTVTSKGGTLTMIPSTAAGIYLGTGTTSEHRSTALALAALLVGMWLLSGVGAVLLVRRRVKAL